MSRGLIESWFPNVARDGFEITSNETPEYNCIAWAGNDTSEKWDPDQSTGRYWPDGVPPTLELNSFIHLFEIEGGYSPCDSEVLEAGFEKIAIYCNFNAHSQRIEVTHAARQLESGKWTSKLGDCEDIEHNSLNGLCGMWPAYGTVAKILKRTRKA